MEKKIAIPLSILAVLLVVGTSFALWQITLRQKNENVITTGCFKVEFTEKNPITLTDAMPIAIDDGRKLVPYEFTITNICNKEADYYINLETLTTENPLAEEYLRTILTTDAMDVFSDTLKEKYINREKVIVDSSNAFMLYGGTLLEKASKTFYLRLWLDEDTPLSSDTMNKTYQGKVTVTTTYVPDLVERNQMISMGISDTSYNPTKNNVYTQNSKYKLSKVSFEKTITNYDNVAEIVDFSNNGDKSVQGYYVKDNPEVDDSKYTLHIQANGRIQANRDATLYFSIPDDSEVVFEGIENIDTSFVEKMSWMFYKYNGDNLDLSNFNTRNVTDMSMMFGGCGNLTDLDLESFNTSKVESMSFMFSNCSSLENLNLSHFNTLNVIKMNYMFSGCNKLINLDVSNFDTRNVITMESMFRVCTSLTDLNLSNFDTSNVTSMSYMFYACHSLAKLDVSSFDTKNVTTMSNMFGSCDSLSTIDVSNFNTSNVTEMNEMFRDCSSLTRLDLSNFNTSKVIYMNYMFYQCGNLTNLELGDFDTSNVVNMEAMFKNCGKLITTITIRNDLYKNYNEMFLYAASIDGTQITVNYTSATSDIVDQMIATKSSNSNVVKGSLVS